MPQNQNRKNNNTRKKRKPGPLGGGPPIGYQPENLGSRRSESQNRARNASTVIAVIMLVAIVVPVLVGACFYQSAQGAYYDWQQIQTSTPANLNYSAARYLKREAAETPSTASLPAPQAATGDNQLYVGETGHYISNAFLTFWRGRGGAGTFGNPLSEEFQQNGRTVQLFEKALFEYYPENGPTNQVQLGLLGRLLAEQNGLKFVPAQAPATPVANQSFFSQTNQTISGLFKTYWDKNNGLALLGYPISGYSSEDGVNLQYFERGRLELSKDGQRVIVSPVGDLYLEAKNWPRPTKFQVELNIDTNEIWQGRTLQIRVLNSGWNWTPQRIQGSVGKDQLRFLQIGPTSKAFEPFSPIIEPKAYPLNVQLYDPANRIRQYSSSVQVIKLDFPLQQLTIPAEKIDLLDDSADTYDANILAPYYALFSPQILWNGKWGWPSNGPLSTDFGEKRSYNNRAPDPNYFHAGLDIAVGEGVPVVAPAAGKVVYTGELKARGNTVTVDHGAGVISLYFHLLTINAKVGQEVKPGDLLGRVGTTGRSDGPHLHWEVRVNGVPTDPRTFQKLDLSN